LYGRSCSFFWWIVVWELMMGAERFLMACRVMTFLSKDFYFSVL
jgi:hypothetical protein